ncbi:hypothetical protein [Hyphomonas sp.]|uniref:hypothetical protein n=1 Tax=Hyphomonas sp. TaxID=87 RepID=UPI00391C5006
MGDLDDYNDRIRKQAFGVPVGPPTTAAQAAADMAAAAQRRQAAAPSGRNIPFGGSDHSVADLLVILAISLAVFGAGVAAATFLSGDIAFLGYVGIAAGGIFGVFCIAALLKRAAKAVFEMVILSFAWTLHKVWRLISFPFRHR